MSQAEQRPLRCMGVEKPELGHQRSDSPPEREKQVLTQPNSLNSTPLDIPDVNNLLDFRCPGDGDTNELDNRCTGCHVSPGCRSLTRCFGWKTLSLPKPSSKIPSAWKAEPIEAGSKTPEEEIWMLTQETPALTPSAASMKSTTPSEMRRPAVTSSEKLT